MDMIRGPPGEPRLDLFGFVGCIVVHHDVNIEAIRNPAIDLFQEIQELLCPVAFVEFADNKPRSDVEGRKQRSGSMADIIMCLALRNARHHGQNRLFTIKGLDLAFLVNA